jgi:hypothetical protein
MRSVDLRSARSRGTSLAITVLLLLALAFVVEGSGPAHSHDDGQLAFYNAECPLAALTAVHMAGTIPTAPTSGWVGLVVLGAFILVPRTVGSSFLRFAHPRAPPLA